MTRRLLFSTCALLGSALALASTANAATGPVVKSVSPLKVQVGQKLTIKGSGFVPGKGKTRVFFVRLGGKGVAAAQADSATKTKVVVTVPDQLNTVLAGKSARFQLRVLGKKFGKWTPRKKSPVVASVAGGAGSSSDPVADCDGDGIPNATDTDDDNDLLPDTQEAQLGTNACNADTDGDGVQDGFEYQSALDLNRTVLFGATPPTPYPGKKPYPNPLYPDAGTDYDGDGLTLGDESALWMKFGGHQFPLNYSDGLSTTVPTPVSSDPKLAAQDSSSIGPDFHDGWLNDGERDADGDGLSNWDESHGRMLQGWWDQTYDGKGGTPKETRYPVDFSGTDMLNPDTDGDGIPDGLDDQDHDGLTNEFEIARPYNWASTTGTNPWAWVQPFNPCKPVFSSTCHRHPPFGYYGDTEVWAGPSPADAISLAGLPGDTPGQIFAP